MVAAPPRKIERRPKYVPSGIERIVATNWRKEMMGPSWKEKFVRESVIIYIYSPCCVEEGTYVHPKKKVAWFAIKFPAKF